VNNDSGARAAAWTGGDVAVVAVVVAYGTISAFVVPERWQALTGTAAGAIAVALASAGGASATELGLRVDSAGDGLRVGLAAAAPVACAVAIASAPARTRHLFSDERATTPRGRDVAYHGLLRIPLNAFGEELLFRSAVLGFMLHRHRPARALIASSAAFGIWHVIPALRSHDANPGVARLANRAGGRITTAATTVVLTGLAGSAFAWLRLRSRSIVAPVVAHAAVNLAGFLAARRSTP